VIAISIDAVPNIPAIGGYFVVALISWLSARSLEQALKDLRVINAELDQRVVERTQELSEALSRETLEAGRREAILNSIADGVVVFDKSGVAILANPSISSLINKPQEKIIGRGLSALLDSEELQPAERTKIASRLQESAQDLSNFRVEWGKRTLSVNAAEVTDDNNQSIGIVAVLRDFTHEAELEKMKNTFVAIVSHELRTPLNAILGYAEMLKESVYGSLNEKQQGASIRIMTNTQRLLTIVSDLLDQAQIEAGRLKIQMVPCRPADLVDNLHSVMDKIASDKGLELITELESSMPPIVLGDPQRLQQILVNLVNNAVKFTEKGHINVRVYNFNKDNWRIQVMDTGNGIPDDAKDYIFESFRQVEGTSTRQHGGVGLGLSIIKQLVELMNGNIEVESEPGKGSIFTVTLPLILQAGTSIQTLQRK
jgi:PAS domain S-box-containing protein